MATGDIQNGSTMDKFGFFDSFAKKLKAKGFTGGTTTLSLSSLFWCMADVDGDDDLPQGYCHMNDDGRSTSFEIDLLGKRLSVIQQPDAPSELGLGHGAVVWDAAVVFCKYLEINRKYSGSKVDSKRVIELGAGTGIAGCSLMMKGAQVTLTDLRAVVDTITRPNALSIYSQVGDLALPRPVVFPLDWTASYPIPDEPYDLVLLTDCVFSPALAVPLVSQIRRVSGPKTEVLCCHEIRDEEANIAFITELERYFSVKAVKKKDLHPDYRSDLIQLLEARLRFQRGGSSKSKSL